MANMNIQNLTNKAAIGLSIACSIHCLALPIAVVLIPTIATLPIANEAFHFWFWVFAVPASVIALSMGCKKHRNVKVLTAGAMGITLLTASTFVGHDLFGELGEKIMTVVASLFIVTSHIFNHRLCRLNQCKTCH